MEGQDISWGQTHQYTEWVIKWTKDFSRSIDYLETRPDIDTVKLGFYGDSWGGFLGAIIPAVEERLKLSILIRGGFTKWRAFPEAEGITYISRVKNPMLMLNGRYDFTFPFETNVKPMFDLLGTPDEHKALKIYETDHFVPKNEMIIETLDWLDKYFGPVNK
jgi:cephalosporin-C deacetylase-like acetyl esterase